MIEKPFRVIGLLLDNGKVATLAWTDQPVSKKTLRQACKRFRHDPDVVRPCVMYWRKLYQTVREMKSELPRY